MLTQVTIATGAEIDYVYNVKNELTSITDKDGSGTITQVVTYAYDMFGNLIGRTLTPYIAGVAGTTTAERYVFDPSTGQTLLAFDGSGNLTIRVLNGAAIDEIFATEDISSLTSPGSVFWNLPDNQGTVKDIINSAGTVEDHLTYDPFGNLTSQTGPAVYSATDTILSAYTGSFYDSATGISYHNDPESGAIGRWYNAATQRWMSQDPSGLTPDCNPYRYVENTPTNYTDPSGIQQKAAATRPQLSLEQYDSNGDLVKDVKPITSTRVGADGTWILKLWGAKVTGVDTRLHRTITSYGGHIDAEYTINSAATRSYYGLDYELVFARKFAINGKLLPSPLLGANVWSYKLAENGHFEPFPPSHWDIPATAGESGSAWGSRTSTTENKLDVDTTVLIGAKCPKMKRWLGAIQVVIGVRYKDNVTTPAISMDVSPELNLSQVAPELDLAAAAKKLDKW